MAELIRTGTTTVMEIGGQGDYNGRRRTEAVMRAYIANGYRSGRWLTRDGKKMEYEWDEEAGTAGFRRAVGIHRAYDGTANGRIRGFLSPSQVDTCTEALLRDEPGGGRPDAACRSRCTRQSIGQRVPGDVQRHGKTPIEWLESIGFPWRVDISSATASFIAGAAGRNYGGDDLGILARHGASVAHTVWVFARRGIAMESFPRYLDARRQHDPRHGHLPRRA